ncbi:hypothetical protein FRC20_003934 [Serendipita sp. 405]|nr:hypothetical protein FRC15_004222 [Serendipita sp. 397]KAG8843516.1 hypothetical protein FRC20_003934 [Serendipita sp. 405]
MSGNSLVNSQTSPERTVEPEVEEKSEIMFPEGHLQRTNNRVPSQEEISFIQKLISDDIREMEVLNSWVEKRQNNINLSQKAVEDLKATIEGLKAIQSFREVKLELYTGSRQKLVAEVKLPTTLPTSLHLRLDIPNLQEINSTHQIELNRCQDALRETIKELEDGERWLAQLYQRLVERMSIIEADTQSIEVLKNCVANLQGVTHRWQQLISAGRRLPDDTLLLIFRIYIQDEIEEIWHSFDEPQSHAVFMLSTICKRWRALISTSPSLWAYIPLPRPTQQPSYGINSRYLECYITAKEVSSSSSGRVDQQTPTAETYVVSDSVLYFEDNYLSQEKIQLSPVASIEIWLDDEGPRKTVACLWSAKKYSLVYRLPAFNETTAPIVEELSLYLPPGSVSDLRSSLEPLINLKDLEITVEDYDIERYEEEDVTTFSLPGLTHLSGGLDILTFLLQSVEIPNLQYIGVYGDTNGDDTPSEAWKPLSDSLNLRDRILSMRFSESPSQIYTGNRLIPILRELTSVETLELGGKFMSPFITHLKRNRKTGPKIQTLILRRIDIDEATLQSLLESRSRPIEDDDDQDLPPPLSIRSITFDYCTGITRRFCEELQESIDHVSVHC